MRVIRYFDDLKAPKLTLWCYLAWYVAVAGCYFDPTPAIWLSAVGISGLIGIALNFATGTPGQRSDGWTKFRLFLFPFCVSSYSTLIKGKGFVLLFPTQAKPLMAGVGACAGVLVFHWICRGIRRAQ